MAPDDGTLVPAGRVLGPLAVAAGAEAVAWAWLLRAGTLAPGWYGRPDLLVGVHLLTVGVVALAIVGAAWQLVPVVTARPGARLPGVAVLGALALAFPGFLHGLHSPGGVVGTASAALLVLALAVRAAAILAALARGARPAARAWLAAAELSLGVGLFLAAELWLARSGLLTGVDAWTVLPRHAAWMLAGWVGGWIVGVGSVLLPMFAVSREPRPALLTLAGALWYGGLVTGSAAVWSAGAASALGLLLWSVATGLKRSLPMAQAGLGLVGLLAALGLAPFAPGELTFTIALVLGVLPLVRGVTQRILPFLLWTHLFADRPDRAPAPEALVPRRLPMAQVLLSTLGALGVAAGRLALPDLARLGAGLALAGALCHLAILTHAARVAWAGWQRRHTLPGLESS